MVLSNFILTVVGCYTKSCVYYFFLLIRLARNYQNLHNYEEGVYYAQVKYGKNRWSVLLFRLSSLLCTSQVLTRICISV